MQKTTHFCNIHFQDWDPLGGQCPWSLPWCLPLECSNENLQKRLGALPNSYTNAGLWLLMRMGIAYTPTLQTAKVPVCQPKKP